MRVSQLRHDASADLAFVCDTYHHFEYPHATLASIYQAVRPGGGLVLIAFVREPGVSREWILSHVRGGRDDFRREIEQAGFVFSWRGERSRGIQQ
jgi:SAM-dependent methyltransferase